MGNKTLTRGGSMLDLEALMKMYKRLLQEAMALYRHKTDMSQ
ncbi:MAG: hypothetical protein ACLPN1_05380 [Dissulfurispiraceae bacterium]|jgi:hypothetical protein